MSYFLDFCQKNDIQFLTPKLNLINKISFNKNLKSLFNGPTLIFYSSDLANLIKLVKLDLFKSIYIPLSFFYSSYLINVNTILNNKFDKNIVNLLYNFSLRFIQQLNFYISSVYFKLNYLKNLK
jgi:hypothetical protein